MQQRRHRLESQHLRSRDKRSSVSSRPVWSTYQVPEQWRLHRETPASTKQTKMEIRQRIAKERSNQTALSKNPTSAPCFLPTSFPMDIYFKKHSLVEVFWHKIFKEFCCRCTLLRASCWSLTSTAAHTTIPNIQEAEAGRIPNLRTVWATQWDHVSKANKRGFGDVVKWWRCNLKV